MASLNAGIVWQDLLEYLGCPARSAVLPTSADCPLCRGDGIRVYHDLGGGWARCRKCRFAGSVFELAAKVWKLDPAETMRRLGDEGLLSGDDLETVLQKYKTRQQKYELLQRVWSQSRQEPPWELLSPQLSSLCRDAVHSHGEWVQREARWVMVCEARWLRGLIRGIPSENLPGQWKSLLLSPLEEMPGRPAGFWCYSEAQQSTVLQSPLKGLRNQTRILGLGELSGSAYPTLVVSTDLEFVVRQQLLSLQEIYRPAPLLGAQLDIRPNPIWRQLGHKLVFWAKVLTPAIVREAASCDARVRVADNPSRGLSFVAQLLALAEKAVSWQGAVDQHLAGLSPERGCNFIKEIGLPPDESRELLDRCRSDIRGPILSLLSATPDAVRYGQHNVSTDGPRLFVDNKLVADAVIRVLRMTDDPDPLCEGEIQFRRATFKFRERSSQMEARPASWLRHQLWKRSLGVPFVASAWRSHLIQLAHLLGNPAMISKPPATGWNAQDDGLVLANYCLQRGGAIKWYFQGPLQKRRRLGPPLPLSGRAIAALSVAQGMDTFWAVAGNVAASLLSGLLGSTPKPLMICGHGDFSMTLAAAAVCNCRWRSLDQNRNQQDLDLVLAKWRQQCWPVLLVSRSPSGLDAGVLGIRGGLDGAILRTRNQFRGVVLAANHGCDLVVSRERAATVTAVTEFGGDVLPAYLHDLAKRNYEIRSRHNSLLQRLLDDMLIWWGELGGAAPPRDCIWSGPEVFLHALAEMLASQHNIVRSVPRGFRDSARQCGDRAEYELIVELDHERLYLPIQQLQQRLLRRHRPLDLVKLQDGLMALELLLEVLSGDIWVLPQSVWQLAAQKRKRPAAGQSEVA